MCSATLVSLSLFRDSSGPETKSPVELDRLNIITIDTHLDVRPDSMALLRAAREVVEEPDFQEVLDSVRRRVEEIEGLHGRRSRGRNLMSIKHSDYT